METLMNVKCSRCGGRLFEELIIIHSLFHVDNTIKEHYCLNCGYRPENGSAPLYRFVLGSQHSRSIADANREKRLKEIGELAKEAFASC